MALFLPTLKNQIWLFISLSSPGYFFHHIFLSLKPLLMKTWGKPLLFPLLFSAMVLFFYACQKEISPDVSTDLPGTSSFVPEGKTKLSVYLTDGPYDYQKVLVDIQRIEVKVDTCSHNDSTVYAGMNPGLDSLNSLCDVWDTLDINPGIYDLLELRNGVDTLLASGFLIQGRIERIKITLGNNDSVMVDSVMHQLHLVKNEFYVNLFRENLDSLSSNNLQLFLDFNLFRSIRLIFGDYWLLPVLQPFGKHSTGEIEGKVRPVHSFGIIKAYNATDTAFAKPWDQGEFKIRGLKAGIYSLFIDGVNGYQDTTINSIIVTKGKNSKLGTIELHH
jgi:hypothetical protein